MSLAVSCSRKAGSNRTSKHQYIMVFHESALGLPKRVELASESPKPAIELARSDAAKRRVDIWEDGEFLCRVSGTDNC
jgi:hypothetical protein